MNSPITGNPMRPVEYEGCLIYECPDTGGELLGGDALAHIVRKREEAFDGVFGDEVAAFSPLFGSPIHETENLVDCPFCGTGMEVVNYGGDTGIFIDKCPECGAVWLDNEELEKIQVLMERWQDGAPEQIRSVAGRLEEARRQAAHAGDDAFSGSRFSIVNALINRFLDAA